MISTEAFEALNPDAHSAIIVLCDHASRHIPADISANDLGLGLSDMQRHIAYDVGAAGIARIIGEKAGGDDDFFAILAAGDRRQSR